MKQLGGHVLLANGRIREQADTDHALCINWERSGPFPYLPPVPFGLSQMEGIPQRHIRMTVGKAGRRRPAARRVPTGTPTLVNRLQDPALRTPSVVDELILDQIQRPTPPLTPEQKAAIDELISHFS